MNGINKKDWIPVAFGEMCKNLNESERAPLANGIERYVGLEHIETGNLHIKSWGKVADGTTFTKRFRKGQVLFGKRRAYLRKAAIADFDGICSGDILVFQANEKVIDPNLLPFIVSSDKFIEYAVQTSAGSLSPRTKFQDLAKLKFLLPPKDQQAKLAELLWAADEVVEKYVLLSKVLELSQRVYGLNNYQDCSNKPTTLKDIIEVNPSVRRDLKDPLLQVSFLAMADVSENGGIINLQIRKLNEVKKGFTSFEEGDILFAKITPCMENGKGALAIGLENGVGFGSTEFHVMRPIKQTDKLYCFYLSKMKVFRKEAEKVMVGSAGQKRVQTGFFDYFKIHLPSEKERLKFGRRMHEFEIEIEKIKDLITSSKQMQKQLINQIFS